MTAIFAGTVDARAGGGDAGIALRGLDRALAAGRLSPLDAHEHRQRVRLAQRVLRRLPAERRHSLAAVLGEVADQASTYDGPRALTLFTTLELNAKHLVHDRLPAPGHDVADGLGVVYRSVPGRGLRFHPLGSFGQLNKYVSAGQRRRATSLAYALLARAHGGRRGLTWEYDFRAAGGNPPWTSGMAQAVAAQALARAGLVPEARLAFAAIPKRLVNERETGTWIRLYGFSDIAVLNAQLQAAHLARRLRAARARRAGGAARDPAAARGAPRASGLRHRPLVALRPRRQRGAARLSPVRDVAALEARPDDGQRALGDAGRRVPRRLAAAARDPRPRRSSTGAAATARRLP